MNIWIIVYIIISIIWAILSFLGVVISSYQDKKEPNVFSLYFIGIPVCLVTGGFWIITLPASILLVIGKNVVKKNMIK